MIITETSQYSRETFLQDIGSYQYELKSNEVKKGDRVILTGKNSYGFLVSFFALVELDCSIVLVDYTMSNLEIEQIFLNSKSNFLISDHRIISLNEYFISPFQRRYEVEVDKKDIKMTEWKNRKDALILYSSGSTGKSKGIIKSGQSFFINHYSTMDRQGYNENDVLLPLVPFTHIYGIALVFVSVLIGSKLVICNYKKIKSIIKSIVNHNVTIVDAVPPTYFIIKQYLKRKREVAESIKVSKVRMWCTGGSPLSINLADEFYALTDKPLLDGYGLTETGNISFNLSDYRNGTGTLLPNVLLKIVDPSGVELPKGQIGEILIKSPGIMEGYLDLPEETARAFTNGWYKTNDLGYLDTKDNLFVIGRMGNAFSRKGNIVYPASIEKVIHDRLGIQSKIVTFSDDKKDSYVLLIIKGDIENENNIKKSIYEVVEENYHPDKIITLKDFRYLPNGKVDGKWIQQYGEKWWKERLNRRILKI